MKTMWAPWRMEYILGEKEKECVFCKAFSEPDELVLFKNTTVMVVMNKFPYINGHLLVMPVRHVSGLDQLSPEEKTHLMDTIDKSIGILKKVINPEGFNVGLNLGKAAGAGIEDHLHFHIVPRWSGDTNALAVFGDIRLIPEHIRETCMKLKPYFENLNIEV